jgi:4-amino-4-deoxy-L-arabinose transferase-like glycosyltransferase
MVNLASKSLSMSRTTLLLLLVCIVAAIPMLYLGATYYIEYDGYWHVFIAKQTWSNLLSEYQATAHPPLFFFLLRAATTLGDSRLIYRLVSILSGIGAVFVIGRIAGKLTGSTSAAVLTALTFGLSASVILISLEVRSYMLCAFFTLLAFYYYLDIVAMSPSQSYQTARIGFSVSLSLAVLSHYSALLLFLACLGAPIFLAALNVDYRARLLTFLRVRWFENSLTVLPPAAIGLALYLFQGRAYATPLGYLSRFYFDPAGPESRMAFLLRNLQNTFNLFSPVSIGSNATFQPALIALCGFTAATVYSARIRGSSRDILRSITTAVFLLMLGVFMAASVRGRYPFGGASRHQFLLFPFLILSIVVLLDRLIGAIPVRNARVAALALMLVAVGANAKTEYHNFPYILSDHATRDVAAFRNYFPQPDVVLLDQFSVVNFFTHYYDWKWRTTGKYGPLYKYTVSKNGNEFTVLRDYSTWNFNFTQASLYRDIKEALAYAPAHSVTVFCMDQFGSHVPRTPSQERIFRENVRKLALQDGLDVKQIFVDEEDVFADFAYARGGVRAADLDLTGPVLSLSQPQETTVNTGFVVQPNGYSALSVTGKNFAPGAAILANGSRLDTTFGNSGWMTALFPSDLYATSGVVELKVVNPDGKSSNAISFLVRSK